MQKVKTEERERERKVKIYDAVWLSPSRSLKEVALFLQPWICKNKQTWDVLCMQLRVFCYKIFIFHSTAWSPPIGKWVSGSLRKRHRWSLPGSATVSGMAVSL